MLQKYSTKQTSADKFTGEETVTASKGSTTNPADTTLVLFSLDALYGLKDIN